MRPCDVRDAKSFVRYITGGARKRPARRRKAARLNEARRPPRVTDAKSFVEAITARG